MSRHRTISAAALVVCGTLAVGLIGGAGAVLGAPYNPAGSFAVAGGRAVAVEGSTGDVFVSEPAEDEVLKLSPEGGVLGVVTGAETPQTKFGGLGLGRGVAVGGEGDVYVASYVEEGVSEARPVVDKFAPRPGRPDEYEYVCEFVGRGAGCHREAEKEGVVPTRAFEDFGALGVAVAGGDLYASDFEFGEAYIDEFGSAGEDLPSSPLSLRQSVPVGVAVDAAGDVFVQGDNFGLGPENVVEYSASGGSAVFDGEESAGVTVDRATGEVFVLDARGGYHIARYDSSGAKVEEFGGGELGEATAIAYSEHNGDVYVVEPSSKAVRIFAAAGGGAPEVSCGAPVQLGPISAKLACHVTQPAGEEADWLLEYRAAGAGTFAHGPAGTIVGEGSLEATLTDLLPQTEYSFRLLASNAQGGETSALETFVTPPAVAGLTTCAGDSPGAETATLQASLEGAPTVTYRFQYGTSLSYGSETEAKSSSGDGIETDSEPLSGLEPNQTYDCRLVAQAELEGRVYTTDGPNGSFKTLARPPAVIDTWSEDVGGNSALVHATLDPENSPTDYYFQYVDAAHYHPGAANPYEEGTTAPVPGALELPAVGEDDIYHTVQQALAGLAPGTTYHYRVVAANSGVQGTGTSDGPDGTFTTVDLNAPVVSTGPAGGVSQTAATLSGTVNPEGNATSYVFEIGASESSLGTEIPGSLPGAGTQPEGVTLTLEDLAPLTTYYYRLSATNANGTSRGAVVAFTTPGTPFSLTVPPAAPLIATPSVAFPQLTQTEAPTVTRPVSKARQLTRKQKRARALQACKRQPKSQRAACERRARKRY